MARGELKKLQRAVQVAGERNIELRAALEAAEQQLSCAISAGATDFLSGDWEDIEILADGESRATYRVVASAERLEALDFILRSITGATVHGSTVFMHVMVEGEDRESLEIFRGDSQALLTAREIGWLKGSESRYEPLGPNAVVGQAGVLGIEIV